MSLDQSHGTPLLTIAIPTWNRADYLSLSLKQLEAGSCRTPDSVEILICDNASTDDTRHVVASAMAAGLPIRYIRNDENIGSDCNIAQCFNYAAGRYVMILGDDDLLVDGALAILLDFLRSGRYGVIGLRPYGYERDFRSEYPGGNGNTHEYSDVGEFVVRLGMRSTFISANVISKDVLRGVDAREFCGTHLVQTHLVYLAAAAAETNLWLDKYLVACKRNNSGGYAFSLVFVEYFSTLLDKLRGEIVPERAIKPLERRILIAYFPFYIWRSRLEPDENLPDDRRRFYLRYSGYKEFWLCVAPILWLPKPLALIYGAVITVIGRLYDGDFRRGARFLLSRMGVWKALGKLDE